MGSSLLTVATTSRAARSASNTSTKRHYGEDDSKGARFRHRLGGLCLDVPGGCVRRDLVRREAVLGVRGDGRRYLQEWSEQGREYEREHEQEQKEKREEEAAREQAEKIKEDASKLADKAKAKEEESVVYREATRKADPAASKKETKRPTSISASSKDDDDVTRLTF